MSSPNFDELLKGKLDEISPSYEPSVWARISKKMPVSPFWIFATQTLPWIIAGLSTLSLVTLVYQTQGLKNETKYLHQTLDSTLRQVGKNQQILLSRKNKIDTVYLVSSSNPNQNQIDTDLLEKAFLKGFRAAQLQYRSEAIASTKAFHSSKNSGFSSKSGENQPTSQISIDTYGIGKGNSSQFNPISAKPGSEISGISAAKSEEQPISMTSKKENPAENEVDSSKKEPIQGAIKQNPKKPFRLANIKPKLGLEVAANLASAFGIGPGMEIELFENIGFNFGLIANTSPAREFVNAQEFNSLTGLQFQKLYANKIGLDPPSRIEEIEIRTSIIEIPIRLKYYIPLKNEFSLLPFAGTHFNLSSQEIVKGEMYFGSNEEHFSFTNSPKTTVFHNYIFGVGIERKGEKVIWQLMPWYTYNFRKSSNFEMKNTFGLSLQVWLPLYKE